MMLQLDGYEVEEVLSTMYWYRFESIFCRRRQPTTIAVFWNYCNGTCAASHEQCSCNLLSPCRQLSRFLCTPWC